MRDNYIIRITNTTLASNVITLNTSKNLAQFELPNWLRSKGKCNIQVVSSSIALSNVLGTAIVPADTTRVVALDSVSAMEFTCTQLPPTIEVERMTYKSTSPFDLIAADNYTTDVVPFQVTLQLSFYEDEHNHDM